MLAVDVSLRRGGLDLAAELEIGAGECVALTGPSGAGKTTLLRLIAGLLRPDSGWVSLGGAVWFDSASGSDLPPADRRVGFVFQDHALFPAMPAWRNVAYGIRGASRAQRRERALASLDRLGMAKRAHARPAELSGGERQRVALARALAVEPRLLLLDEPLASLDAGTAAVAAGELAAILAASEAPALIVTHDFSEAAELADRVIVLDRGRIIQAGTPTELAATPGSGFVADLIGAVVLRGVAGPGPDGLTRVDLEGGGQILSIDPGVGPVAASVFPWEIALGDPAAAPPGSALNHLPAEILSVTRFGNRARVALGAPQPLFAEVTSASIARLGLRPGSRVGASWKATATRLSPHGLGSIDPERGGDEDDG